MVFGVCRSMRDRAERSGGRSERPAGTSAGDSERAAEDPTPYRPVGRGLGTDFRTDFEKEIDCLWWIASKYWIRPCATASRLRECRLPVREKLSIARLLLDELHVDRIEVASARVSDGEFESVRRIAAGPRNAVFSTGWRFWVSSTAEFRCGGSPMPDAA